jgi:site-specific DNA recombinase
MPEPSFFANQMEPFSPDCDVFKALRVDPDNVRDVVARLPELTELCALAAKAVKVRLDKYEEVQRRKGDRLAGTVDLYAEGTMYKGAYEPVVSRELWDQVQAILDGRGAKKTRKMKEQFAFSGLITCGHCGCAMVGEIKKGRYIYYHCTGFKGKCPEPYTREEVLEERFTDLLKGIAFSDETLVWVRQALRESHRDERQFHDDAIAKLHREHRRLQDRIDAMYEDKLDGRIANDFFDSKAAEMRAAQTAIIRDLGAHQTANHSYIEEGVQLLELAHNAHALFESQPATAKRKLLDFVLSNCTWKGGELTAKYRQPFDVLAVAVASEQQRVAGGMAETAQNEIWLPRHGFEPRVRRIELNQ